MFWIEESPTNAADDDSDVPFDECPGKPMACEQEIELIIKPDDDFDDHTWPETLSASGGASSTLVSSEENQSTVKDSDASANDEEDDVEEDAEQQGDCSDSGSAAVDDDATQIMGERHNNEVLEDEHTFGSAQDRSFIYLATTLPSSEAAESSSSVNVVAENDQAVSSPLESSSCDQDDENQDAPANESCSPLKSQGAPTEVSTGSIPVAQQQDDGTNTAPISPLEDEDTENSAPGLVTEPEVVDDAENDVSSMSESETKPLNEMNDQEDEGEQDEEDWYDRWEPLEETDDGISCISNMFAPLTPSAMQIPPLVSNPTMMTDFSDVIEPECAKTIKSDPGPLPATEVLKTPTPKQACVIGKQVELIFEGEDGSNTNMTLTEFLNANCLQGTRKERRLRIIERQRTALDRIVVASASAISDVSAAPGFFEQLLDFDPMEQLQNMWRL